MVDIARATCPRCGATISADDPAGLCPRCLASGAQDGQSQDAGVYPSAPQGARRKPWLALAAAVIGLVLLVPLWIVKACWSVFGGAIPSMHAKLQRPSSILRSSKHVAAVFMHGHIDPS